MTTTKRNLLDIEGKVFYKYIYPMTSKEFLSAKNFDEYHKILKAKFILNEDQMEEVLMEWDKKEPFETLKLTSISMERGRGYGQYNIIIDLLFEEEKDRIKIHSTDSEIWDDYQDIETYEEREKFLLNSLEYLIERHIDDYISSK